MKGKRKLVHPEYYKIRGYQILLHLTDEDMAKYLGMAVRTYKDKVKGYADFKPSEGIALAKILQQSQDEIFLT